MEAVRVMARIAETAEKALPYRRWLRSAFLEKARTITDAIGQATCEIASELKARAIITSTASGYTARMIARHRPHTPIVATTPRQDTLRRLALVWGVQPMLAEPFANTDEMIKATVRVAVAKRLVEPGDLVVITAGIPFGGKGRTNMLKVHVVGEE